MIKKWKKRRAEKKALVAKLKQQQKDFIVTTK